MLGGGGCVVRGVRSAGICAGFHLKVLGPSVKEGLWSAEVFGSFHLNFSGSLADSLGGVGCRGGSGMNGEV